MTCSVYSNALRQVFAIIFNFIVNSMATTSSSAEALLFARCFRISILIRENSVKGYKDGFIGTALEKIKRL